MTENSNRGQGLSNGRSVYKAIITKWLGPSNHKPSRIRVSIPGGRFCYYNWDWDYNAIQNHERAMMKLRDRLGWTVLGEFQAGEIANGSFAWVIIG